MIHVTTSQIKEFKNCRFKFWLSYRKLLKPRIEPEALTIGSSYHDKVEQILKTGDFIPTDEPTDAMARAFKKYILPSIPKIIATEKQFSVQLSEDVWLDGKIDAIAEGCLVEHKTTKNYIDEGYLYRVHFIDSQVTNYLIATENQPVCYTVITKPTIRIKKDESMSEYIKRCEEWYDTETYKKVKVFFTGRTDEQLEKQRQDIINIAREMKNCENWYKNETACLLGKCQFSGICPSYKDNMELVDFEYKEAVNEELSEEEN